MSDTLELHDSVLGLKAVIRTMGDSAASKFLHVLLLEAVVMWDNNIKPFGGTYENFLTENAPTRAAAATGVRQATRAGRGVPQNHLGYGVRKTMAKYLDEYNWCAAVGER